jgi:UDP-N-acetyl-D-glucosamine dehydrogenase
VPVSAVVAAGQAVSSPREAEPGKLIDAAFTKPFGFMPFRPGPGVGGHCLPIDPSYLSWRVERALGRSFRFVELANDISGARHVLDCRRVLSGPNVETL